MNRKEYNSDSRYRKILEQMDLLEIMDITTTRQAKNGTIVWKLPIKDQDSGILIEVASFASGYVRNQGKSTRSNFQLNKRFEGEPEYFKDYEWVTKNDGNGDYAKQEWTGKYRAFTTRKCKLIPLEIDRLEYLISYCLKNYYIKHANQVPNGDFVPKWRFDNAIDERDNQSWRDKVKFLQSDVDEHANTVIKLEEKLFDITEKYNSYKKEYKNRASEVNDLQNKLATIQRIATI